MTSLLGINNDMNVFNLSTHSGPRPLYNNIIALVEMYPELKDEVMLYPLSSMAIERDEEVMYEDFSSKLSGISLGDNSKVKSV